MLWKLLLFVYYVTNGKQIVSEPEMLVKHFLPYGIIFMSNDGNNIMETTEEVAELKRQRGRPAAFDPDEALEKALQIFWTRGYEGASMTELTAAMGIYKPSLYAAFGNKEELFRKVLAKYVAGPVAYLSEAMQQPTARESVEMLLTKSVEFLTDKNTPSGCMVVQGALSCGQSAELIQRELIAHRQAYEKAIRQRLEQAQKQSELPGDLNAAEFAKYLATVHQGMSVQATSGATRKELLAVVNQVLKNWPA
jgi:AcrR family transcriptional regulator